MDGIHLKGDNSFSAMIDSSENLIRKGDNTIKAMIDS